jgi:hypothetical protein
MAEVSTNEGSMCDEYSDNEEEDSESSSTKKLFAKKKAIQKKKTAHIHNCKHDYKNSLQNTRNGFKEYTAAFLSTYKLLVNKKAFTEFIDRLLPKMNGIADFRNFFKFCLNEPLED